MKELIPAGVFKAKCLGLLDEVAEHRKVIVITKWGKPVARLIPVDTSVPKIIGRMKGTIEICGDIVASTGEVWDAER